jgi:hypothetical protein
MSMIEKLEAACAKYEKRIEETVARVTDDEWSDHNPGAIAGLYRDLTAMTTDLYRRRQREETLRRISAEDDPDNVTPSEDA